MSFDGYTSTALEHLRRRGIKIGPGLHDPEVSRAESALGAPFPLDLKILLQMGLPCGKEFPDWRKAPESEVRHSREWVERAFSFDIEQNDWWFEGWGRRPESVTEAKQVAGQFLTAAPPLVRVYAHRFMPTDPAAEGNPVVSVWQASDSIVFGNDLADYLHREFGIRRPPWAARAPRAVPFWTTVLDLPPKT